MLYFYVMAGGAFGALMRYLAVGWMTARLGKEFPWGVLAVNVLGSFLLGVLLAGLAQIMPKGRELYLLLGVGALGGFTTFSAFTYDTYMLIERSQWWGLLIYTGGSVLFSLGAFVLGMWLARAALA